MTRNADRSEWKQIARSIGILLAVIIVGFTGTYLFVSKILASPSVSVPPAKTQKSALTTETAAAPEPAPAPEPVAPPEPQGPLAGKVIVLDPGHSGAGVIDSSLEPIGPGATEKKEKDVSGTRGINSKTAESEINLTIGQQLKTALEAKGATVYMTRTSEEVDVSNSQRAAVANDNHADLFLRLHCDGNASSSASGISMQVPGENSWTAPIVNSSQSAGETILAAVIAATGAQDRGVQPRADLAGFNYSKVPSILIEMGFMTNPDEDAKLNDSAYQQKLVEGLTQGCINWMSQQQ